MLQLLNLHWVFVLRDLDIISTSAGNFGSQGDNFIKCLVDSGRVFMRQSTEFFFLTIDPFYYVKVDSHYIPRERTSRKIFPYPAPCLRQQWVRAHVSIYGKNSAHFPREGDLAQNGEVCRAQI